MTAPPDSIASESQPISHAIMGASLATWNRGVSALAASSISLLNRTTPGSTTALMMGHNTSGTFNIIADGGRLSGPIVNYRLSPRSKPSDHLAIILAAAAAYRLIPSSSVRNLICRRVRWIDTLVKAKIVGHICGGDSFSDIYGLKVFFLILAEISTCLLVRRDVILFPQTFGPYKRSLSRRLAAFIVKRASLAIARDSDSYATAVALSGSSANIRLSPDVAFALKPDDSYLPILKPPLAAENESSFRIGININGLMFYSPPEKFELKLNYESFLVQLVIRILSEESCTVQLIPHTFAPPGSVQSDPNASRHLYSLIPPHFRARLQLLEGAPDQHAVKKAIGNCDLFIGSRMHACIAALSQGIPCVGVAYSKKFAGVFESVGVKQWIIDARETTADDAVERVMNLFHQRQDARGVLLRSTTEAQNLLTNVFRELATHSHFDRSISNSPRPVSRQYAQN